MVVVAQLAEHRIVVPSVVGSSPIIHPEKHLEYIRGVFLLIGNLGRLKSLGKLGIEKRGAAAYIAYVRTPRLSITQKLPYR